MRKYVYLLAVAVIAASSVSAHADTISTFDFENFVFFETPAVSSGNITINTTTGVATGLNFNYSSSLGAFSVSGIDEQIASTDGSIYEVIGVSPENANDSFTVIFPGSSLINYAGGPDCPVGGQEYCALLEVDNGVELFDDTVQSGELTLVSSTTTGATPEPSTFTLLGIGLIAAVGAFRRKLFNA